MRKSRVFQNYHRHTHYTNPKVSDSIARNEDYAKRAAELGHGIISSCEHGYQGRYIECHELAEKHGLKFLFGAEAYWVNDRKEADRTNCHIFSAQETRTAGKRSMMRYRKPILADFIIRRGSTGN